MATDVIAGKYRIIREIARSNDIVYEAVDAAMGRRVAIKELLVPPNLTGAARQERVERFNREARAAGKLSHHNIVTVYDFGEDNGRYYIAMEYLEGGTLRDHLQAAGALPTHEAADIARQVLSALAHAHQHSVVHRDVKPDNIHIVPDGVIKLTDFGIARLTEEASLTGDGQVFGTPSYMSPEQIVGRHIDHRSDLFSAAVVLYEMLAGRKPFTGDSVVSITYAIMNAEPAPLVGVPYQLEQVVMQGLAKEPARRFQSADAMRHALASAAAPQTYQPDGRTGMPALFLGPGAQAPQSPTPGAPSWPTSAPWPAGHPAPDSPQGLAGTGVPPVYDALGRPTQSWTGNQAAQGQSGNPVTGPFASWGPQPVTAQHGSPPSSGAPPSAPPAYPARAREPLLSAGARTFLNVMLLSFVLAGIILGGVLLFVRSYEEHQRSGATMATRSRLAEADRLAQVGDLPAAAALYARVLETSGAGPEGRIARSSLAEVWNRLGVQAAQSGRYAEAYRHFANVLDLYNRYQGSMTAQDVARHRTAYENLEAVRSRAQFGEPGISDTYSPGLDPPQPHDPGADAIARREAAAMDLLQNGDRAYKAGDTDSAREYWTRAAAEAPGTEPSRTALERLSQTAQQLPF